MSSLGQSDKILMTTRPATIMDVARHVGLSKTTVSAALTGNGRLMPETRDMVLQAAKELNYRAHPHAQSLRKRNSGEIILVSGHMDLGVATRKMTLIQEQLSSSGFNAPIYAYSLENGSAIDQNALICSVAKVQPRAVVCNVMGLMDESRALLQDLQQKGAPVVCYDTEFEDAEEIFDQVIFDREDNTYQSARHLLELGHRDLGLVSFGKSPTSPVRQRGFKRALNEFGIAARPEWIFSRAPHGPAEFIEILGAQAAHHFLGLRQRPTGVCVVNDLAALAFIGEMERAGVRVPRQMSVIGHDDIPICQFAPLRLSSVSHPVEQIAEAVVERVTERLQNSNIKPEKRWLKGKLQARDSTTSPPRLAL